jgi:hypothetical protein
MKGPASGTFQSPTSCIPDLALLERVLTGLRTI